MFIEIPRKYLSRKLLTLIIIIIIIFIVHLFAVDKERFQIIKKNLIKVRKKREKIRYLYKNVISFFLFFFCYTLKSYQNFKNHHLRMLNKTCLVNKSSRTVFWKILKFFKDCICLNVQKLDDSFTFI